MVAHSRFATSRRPVATGRRMLVAAALVGAAALLAGCATAGGPGATPPTSAPSQPSAPPAGSDPVPLDESQLQDAGLLDGLGAQGIDVRWLQPGASIAVLVGGSGSGGDCIPQPHAARLEGDAIVVRFDAPAPDVACTMDFRLHGWELALPASLDAAEPVSVQLVDAAGDDETTEVELGPDRLLSTDPTADPQPSLVPGAPVDAAPAPIPAHRLPDVSSAVDATQDPPVAVHWLEPGTTLAVLLAGSGTEACVPQPIAARSTGPGTIEIAFERLDEPVDCSADLALHGWRLPLAEAVSATLDVQVTITGLGDDAELVLAPTDVLELD